MALPKLLQKLFQNGGAGPKLRPEIMPIQTVDGYAPDANGNVDTKRLPLSGGTMTGAIKNTGKTAAVSSDTDGKSIVIAGASSAENGAYLHLYGKDNTGCFYLNAIDNENNSTLKGMPNGSLTWRGSQIERIVKSSSNYVRYEHIQICWGTVTIPANLRRYEVTLPVAFVNTSYSMNCTSQTDGVAISSWGRTTTGFTINALGSSDGAYNYEKIVSFMCVGWWN